MIVFVTVLIFVAALLGVALLLLVARLFHRRPADSDGSSIR